MGRLNIGKAILGLLIVANIAFFGYNAYQTYQRVRNEDLDKAKTGAKFIKQNQINFRADLDKITSGGIIKIGRASEHFQKKAREQGIDTTTDLYIPSEPKSKNLSQFTEDTWKIDFRNKQKTFSLKEIARYCNTIEQSAPGFQVKEIDVGKRSEAYGNDEWKPGHIIIRRLERKRAK